MASSERPDTLGDELDEFLQDTGSEDVALLRAKHMAPNRFDGPEVAYFKRLLQHALAPARRSKAINLLFERHVTTEAAEFVESLYLTVDQAKAMREAGNEFGGHGSHHLWHAFASEQELDREISGSIQALKAIGAPVSGGFYCYPFGSHNQTVCQAVSQAGFQIGFTVDPTLYAIGGGDPLMIPRLDTNDLPKHPPEKIDPWLQAAQEGRKR